MPATTVGAEVADKCELLRDGAVTVAGLLKEYGISRSRAYELMNDGSLAYSTCGKKRLIPRRAVATLLASTLVNGESVV
ncbi:hypothetical protein [Gemmata sp.]|uniref:hypothetical protein n=1 Tax=Gemmata sp. TaxID=1914242 RepID=UPI003F6EE89F